MKVKKIPMRSCVVTREKCEKKDLIRVVRTPEGEVYVDLKGKMNGRGAYISKNKNFTCLHAMAVTFFDQSSATVFLIISETYPCRTNFAVSNSYVQVESVTILSSLVGM